VKIKFSYREIGAGGGTAEVTYSAKAQIAGNNKSAEY
jgi:hypothetical protein